MGTKVSPRVEQMIRELADDQHTTPEHVISELLEAVVDVQKTWTPNHGQNN